MSKKKSDIVFIVGYDPINDHAGCGGFDWFYDRQNSMDFLKRQTQENEHFVWFRAYKVNVTGDKKADQLTITNQIEQNIMDHGSDGDWE